MDASRQGGELHSILHRYVTAIRAKEKLRPQLVTENPLRLCEDVARIIYVYVRKYNMYNLKLLNNLIFISC